MDRYEHTVLGLWMFVIGYGLHWLLLPFWRKGQLPVWSHIPLSIISWLTVIGLLLPFKDFVLIAKKFFDHPSTGMAFEVVMFMSLVLLIAWGYQNSDVFRWDRLKPFLRESLLFKHTVRTKEDVFAKEEQGRIASLARTPHEKKLLSERMTTEERIPLDQQKELNELAALRSRRRSDAGKEEVGQLREGMAADITDVCRLYHIDNTPHPRFKDAFRLTIDPGTRTCRSCLVFDQLIREHLRNAKQWFRFKQDLFDYAETLFYRDWMGRFKDFYDVLELECYQEEKDSFGLPTKTAFLRIGLPVSLLERYKDGTFIATELEKTASVTWLEGEAS